MIPCLNEEDAIGTVVARRSRAIDELGVDGEVDRRRQRVRGPLGRARRARRARASSTSPAAATEARTSPGSTRRAAASSCSRTPTARTTSAGSPAMRRRGCGAAPTSCSARGSRATILPGAMPWSHRYIGNPILTGMLNVLFGARVSDAHCGLRALRRDARPAARPLGDRDGVRVRDGDQGGEARPAASRRCRSRTARASASRS